MHQRTTRNTPADQRFTSLRNNRGVALVMSYMLLTVLLTLSVGFATSTVTELNHAKRYKDSAQAFWLAEAGIARFLTNLTMLDSGNVTLTIGTVPVTLSKIDTYYSWGAPESRVVTASATVRGVTREVTLEFPARPPSVFDNTISCGGNLSLNALFAGMDVDNKTRITGTYSKSGLAIGNFDDRQTGITADKTTLKYPDADNNGTPDEFTDFVEYNRAVVASYPAEDVVYIQTDNAVTIWPDSSLADKKIIYVEGSSAGTGDVNIYFDSSWRSNQNVTVISTGTVKYVQPLQNPSSNSQLNTVSWDGYSESAILYSSHSGVTYSHSTADYGSIIAISKTSGNLITNGNATFVMGLAWKWINYENPLDGNGLVPPGFEGLISYRASDFSTIPSDWREQ